MAKKFPFRNPHFAVDVARDIFVAAHGRMRRLLEVRPCGFDLRLHWKMEDLHQRALHHPAVSHLKEHRPENNSSPSEIILHIQEIPSARQNSCVGSLRLQLLLQPVDCVRVQLSPRGRPRIPASPTRCRHQSRRAMTYGPPAALSSVSTATTTTSTKSWDFCALMPVGGRVSGS